MYTLPLFLSAYARSTLEAAPVMVGMIVGSYGFTQMILRIPVGVFSDVLRRRKAVSDRRHGGVDPLRRRPRARKNARRRALFRGLAGVAVSTWVAAHRALLAPVPAGKRPPEAMWAAVPPRSRLSVAGDARGAGFAAERIGTEAAFLMGAAAALAGLVVVLGAPPSRRSSRPRRSARWRDVVRDRSLLISTLLATVYQCAAWGTVLGFTGNWASEVVGLDASALGLRCRPRSF